MDNNIIITPMCKDDIDDVHKIFVENFTGEVWSKNSISADLENKYSLSYTAKIGDTIIGFINGNSICGECYINNIAILNGYKSIGIGTFLLSDFIINRKNAYDEFIILEVRKNNLSAIKFYQKHNFKIIATRKNYYSNPTDDGISMKLDFDINFCNNS